MGMLISEFFDAGREAQQDFARRSGLPGPQEADEATAIKLAQDYLCHAIEEIIECRMEFPRRPWRVHEPTNFAAGLKEFCDILLMLRAAAAYFGFSGEEIERMLHRVIERNKQRLDHNGTHCFDAADWGHGNRPESGTG